MHPLATASTQTRNGFATDSCRPKKKIPTIPITARAPAPRRSGDLR